MKVNVAWDRELGVNYERIFASFILPCLCSCVFKHQTRESPTNLQLPSIPPQGRKIKSSFASFHRSIHRPTYTTPHTIQVPSPSFAPLRSPLRPFQTIHTLPRLFSTQPWSSRECIFEPTIDFLLPFFPSPCSSLVRLRTPIEPNRIEPNRMKSLIAARVE